MSSQDGSMTVEDGNFDTEDEILSCKNLIDEAFELLIIAERVNI